MYIQGRIYQGLFGWWYWMWWNRGEVEIWRLGVERDGSVGNGLCCRAVEASS